MDTVWLKQNIDPTLPAGRLILQVLGAVAEFEREALRERVKAGMNQARRVGKHVGRPARRRLGRAEIEKIRLLRSQGKSVRQLAKELGAPPVDDRQTGTQLITGCSELLAHRLWSLTDQLTRQRYTRAPLSLLRSL